MLSVRPRELRLVIQHHEAAMMTISYSSFIVYRFSRALPNIFLLLLIYLVLRQLSTNQQCDNDLNYVIVGAGYNIKHFPGRRAEHHTIFIFKSIGHCKPVCLKIDTHEAFGD